MQLFSLFPQILFLSPIIYTLYRGVIAAYLLYDASEQFKKDDWTHKILVVLQVLAAVGLVLGAYVQAASMLSALIFALQMVFPKYRLYPYSTIILLFLMSIGQVVFGAGLFSFDIPL